MMHNGEAKMKNAFLVGKKIYLRSPDLEKDVEEGEWHQWFNDAEITKYLMHGVYPNTKEKQFQIIKNSIDRTDMLLMAIVDIEKDLLLGTVSLKSIDFINRTAEIAIVIGATSYPKWAPLEAMALMTQHGFDRLNLNKIYAGQHVGLWKWVNRLELLGYKLEGYLRETHIRNGKACDSVRMGLLASEFYTLLKERDGKYIPDDFLAFLGKTRRNNVCMKIAEQIQKIYDDANIPTTKENKELDYV